MKVSHDTEVWFELQNSLAGANDWYTTGSAFDTIETAQRRLTIAEANNIFNKSKFDYRIVKKTLTEEVVS